VASSGIVAVYLAARRSDPASWTGRRRALAAALLYAVAWQLVLHGRYAVTDACLAALTAWTLAVTAQYLATRRVRWGIAAAFAAGVAFAFKAPGVVTALIPGFAALLLLARAGRSGQRRAGHAAVLASIAPVLVVTYVVLNPHVVDRSHDAFHDLAVRYRQTHDGGFSSAYIRRPGIDHLASASFAIAARFASRSTVVSLAVSGLAAWGIVRDVRRRRPLAIVAAAYAVCLVLSVALPNRAFLYRNYIVVIPAMCVGFGAGAVYLGRAVAGLGRPWRGAVSVALAGAAVVALVVLPAAEAIATQENRSDARVLALAWIAGQPGGDGGTGVAVTPAVFGKRTLGGYKELRDAVDPLLPGLATHEVEACPDPANGPLYVVSASYRDTHKAPPSDPWEEVWWFRECPGYEQAAAFGPRPVAVDLGAYPTWYGRVAVVVLRKMGGPIGATAR
jgi:4-amino-4-deoxy-L-arabinose transferase-like glycosyltransferase